MDPRKSLKKILQAKTQYYLEKDNPDLSKKSLQAKLPFLFSTSGKAGRLRAVNYQEKYIDVLSDQALLDIVYEDVLNEAPHSRLGTSKKFRFRLKEGVCDYFGVIQKQREEEIKKRLQSVALNSGRYLQIDINLVRNLVLDRIIENHYAAIVAQRSMSERFHE